MLLVKLGVPAARPLMPAHAPDPQATAAAAAPRVPPIAGTDRFSLYDALCAMLPPQFSEAVFRLGIPPAQLSAETAPQARRAIEVIGQFEQPGAPGIAEVERVIRRVAPRLLG
jgi:hypothetical protein